MKQPALFDLRAIPGKRISAGKRKVPLDREFVLAALRDIHRLSSEAYIRQIAEDVLFAHRIPTREGE